jgi:translation initiation factor 1
MKKNLFEMGASWDDEWSSDNKQKVSKKEANDIKEPSKHRLYISKEKRRGKIVTIVQPFYLPKDKLKALLKSIKSSLGCGGTIKENSLEFQGEVSQKLKDVLTSKDFRFR